MIKDSLELKDSSGRTFKNLRVSLTASCNYACTYCVPPGQVRQSAKHEMPVEDLIDSVQLLQQAAGIDKLRITGGEPLILDKFEPFISGLDLNNFKDVSLTTNGQLLKQKAQFIAEQGIKRINVSLDTLDGERFRDISKGGDLPSVLAGIEAALDLGIKVKINTVPLKSQNINQILPLLDYCLERDIELRFIELMQMGHLKDTTEFEKDYYGMEDLLAVISDVYQVSRLESPVNSTSIRFKAVSLKNKKREGMFGVIANESEPFCSGCDRLRLTSSGHLHGCLSNEKRHYIGDLLSLPKDEALLKLNSLLSAALADKQAIFSGNKIVMRAIGG